MTAAFTLTWYRLGLELLDGPQVKAIGGREGAGEETAVGGEGQAEVIGELNPAGEEEDAQIVPRSKS